MHMPFLKNRYRFLGHFVLSISDGIKFEFLVNPLLMESGRLYKLKHKDRMELFAPWTRREETVEINISIHPNKIMVSSFQLT